jgi:glycosyltransferase involved in cell wall biosynthesis
MMSDGYLHGLDTSRSHDDHGAGRRGRALMGLLFYPRGGSAHVARNLAHWLPEAGWDVTLVSGSIVADNHFGDAVRFYDGLDVRPVDMSRALRSPDPMAADPPLHPSYEDRAGAPDRVFAALNDGEAAHQAAAWARALAQAGAAEADVLHLHHLTPLYDAAERVAPQVPVLGHVHGTELLMLEAIEQNPRRWPHGIRWAERLRGWAHQAQRLIVPTIAAAARAERVLGVPAASCVAVPNGFDPTLFTERAVDKRAVWPALGLDVDTPVILYVGRFTEVKRVPLLIEAYAAAVPGFHRRAPLVIVGGFPGEHEGEHPEVAIRRTGVGDVHLAGWHGHAELPTLLAAADVLVLPSVNEQFGQVIVEAMACGLPAIAVDRGGPAEIVEHGETGWLVEPDDAIGLENALVEAVNRPAERRRRGANAARTAHERYAWPELAERVAALYRDVRDATSLRKDAALSG